MEVEEYGYKRGSMHHAAQDPPMAALRSWQSVVSSPVRVWSWRGGNEQMRESSAPHYGNENHAAVDGWGTSGWQPRSQALLSYIATPIKASP
jgi:hypothetical protein